MMTPEKLRIFSRFLNLSENDSGSPETDYRSVYVYADGNHGRKQVTLARGFTQDGGNLWRVIAQYIANGGEKAEFFKGYEGRMRDGDLWMDKAFINALKGCSDEPAMRLAQDDVFNDAYLNPALKWADAHGFREVLSTGVIVDSYLHSGSMLGWLMDKFPERKPIDGGDEKAWITAYCRARLHWFENSTGALHTCQFRPKFFLGEIAKGNWNLDCPLVVSGKGVIC
jgi:chitosanase